jgi:plasmid stabilization system protein ParE
LDELAAIADHISASSPVYAEAVVSRIGARVEGLRSFPELGLAVPEFERADIRELIERPYRLIYRDLGSTIEVLSIVHGRQDLRSDRPL